MPANVSGCQGELGNVECRQNLTKWHIMEYAGMYALGFRVSVCIPGTAYVLFEAPYVTLSLTESLLI